MATTPASEARLGAPPVRTRLLWTLGSGAFGLAYSITTISVALPPLLHTFTDSGSLIGLGLSYVYGVLTETRRPGRARPRT